MIGSMKDKWACPFGPHQNLNTKYREVGVGCPFELQRTTMSELHTLHRM